MLLERIKNQFKTYIKKRVKEEVIKRLEAKKRLLEAQKKELAVNMVYVPRKKYKRALYSKEEAIIKATK